MLVPKWLGCGFGSSKRECNGKEWQMGWTVSCGLHISYTLWNTDVFCTLPTGGLSSATGARYERCGCWWRLSWCRSGIFFEFQNTRWIEMFQCLTITWSSSPTQQFAHSLQHTGGNTLSIAWQFFWKRFPQIIFFETIDTQKLYILGEHHLHHLPANNHCFVSLFGDFLSIGATWAISVVFALALACLLSAQSQTVSFHLEGWLYVFYHFLYIFQQRISVPCWPGSIFSCDSNSHPSNTSFGQVDSLKMSGQRVTGVVVGGEEVSAKEVQLLSKKTCGAQDTSIFGDLVQIIWSNWVGKSKMMILGYGNCPLQGQLMMSWQIMVV